MFYSQLLAGSLLKFENVYIKYVYSFYLQKEIHDLEMQLAEESENKQSCLQQFTAVKAELEKELYAFIFIYHCTLKQTLELSNLPLVYVKICFFYFYFQLTIIFNSLSKVFLI